jgi:hypothetical protein
MPHVFMDDWDDHICGSVLICDRYGSWYPIADNVLELVPPALLYERDLVEFEERFGSELKGLGLASNSKGLAFAGRKPAYADQIKQREHFDNYAEGLRPGFVDYPHSPFLACRRAPLSESLAVRYTKTGGLDP